MAVQETNFTVRSNHPYEEYIRFLKYAEVILNTALKQKSGYKESRKKVFLLRLHEKIVKESEEMKKSDPFHYGVMDMLYAGEKHLAEKMCSQKLIKHYMILLNNPSGKNKEIYINFANYYNMKNQMQKQ